MLTVRRSLRAASSLLRQSVHLSQPLHRTLLVFTLISSPSFPVLALSQSFSQNLGNDVRRRAAPMDLATTLQTFQEIRREGGANLTYIQASTLVVSLVKHKCLDEYVDLLRICQERGVQLKASARRIGFSFLCDKKEFELALKEFESLRSDENSNLKPWVFAGGLIAATKLNRPNDVKDIFQHLLKGNEHAEASGEDVYEMMKEVRDRGIQLSEFALQVLAGFAAKSYQPDMALEVFSMIQEEGFELTLDVYSSVLAACSGGKRWNDTIRVFEEMPEALVPLLDGSTLGRVIVAHNHSEDNDLKSRGLDIFGHHKAKWNVFACVAALEGLLRTGQFEELFALANDMQHHGIKWESTVCKVVALAYMHKGSIEKARTFVRTNAKVMKYHDICFCYHELIEHYAIKNGDFKEACQVYLEMIDNKLTLTSVEWCNALELALRLPDTTMYWRLRSKLRADARGGISEHLLLPPPKRSEQQQNGAKRDMPLVAAEALKRFHDIQKNNGKGLTVNVASELLATIAKDSVLVGDCVEMWHYFEEQGVFPKLFARLATFSAFYQAHKYDHALEMFKTLMNDDGFTSMWAYSNALNTAIKLRRHSSVIEILRHMQEHNIKITANNYNDSIASCMRANEWVLALTVLSAMQNNLMTPSSSTFNRLLAGCRKDKFWNMVIEVYNKMSDDLRQLLDEEALGAVLLAHSRVESNKLQLRTVDICNAHKTTCKPFPYEVGMSALLETKQYSEVLSLAEDAANQGFKLTPLMCRSVVMAHIRSGSMEQARQLLDENARCMTNLSVECYRELIQYYAEVRSNKLEASKLCVLMMQNNSVTNVEDWRTALELALQLPDRAIYWDLRKWLRLHGKVPLSELREHLLLPEDNHHAATFH